MARLLMSAALFAAFALMQGNTIDAQEKGKLKGFLPAGWKKIGLTDDQTQKVYGVQAKYKTEIDKLQDKIDELKAQQKTDMMKILTAEQKKALAGEKMDDEPKKEASKSDPKKDK